MSVAGTGFKWSGVSIRWVRVGTGEMVCGEVGWWEEQEWDYGHWLHLKYGWEKQSRQQNEWIHEYLGQTGVVSSSFNSLFCDSTLPQLGTTYFYNGFKTPLSANLSQVVYNAWQNVINDLFCGFLKKLFWLRGNQRMTAFLFVCLPELLMAPLLVRWK